mgnify:CR=1 FL=1
MGADSGDSGGGGGGSEKEEKSSGKTVASVQAQINAALDASGGEWTSELNDLVAERESLKGASGEVGLGTLVSGDKGTATYNMFGDVVSEGAPSDLQLQEQSKFAQQQVQPTVTTTPDPFDPFTYADDDGTIPTVFDNVALGATPAAATTTEEGIPLGPEDFAPYPEEQDSSFLDTVKDVGQYAIDTLKGAVARPLAGVSDKLSGVGALTSSLAPYLYDFNPVTGLSKPYNAQRMNQAISDRLEIAGLDNQVFSPQRASAAFSVLGEGEDDFRFKGAIGDLADKFKNVSESYTKAVEPLLFKSGEVSELEKKGLTSGTGGIGEQISNLEGSLNPLAQGENLADAVIDTALSRNPLLLGANLLGSSAESIPGGEVVMANKLDELIASGEINNSKVFTDALAINNGNVEAAKAAVINQTLPSYYADTALLSSTDALLGKGNLPQQMIGRPISQGAQGAFEQYYALDNLEKTLNTGSSKKIDVDSSEDVLASAVEEAIYGTTPTTTRVGIKTDTKVDTDTEPDVDTESPKVQPAPDAQDVNIQVGGIPTLLDPNVISPELSGPKLLTQRPTRIPDYGPPSVYNPNISKTAGQLAVTPLGIESAYTGQKAIEPPRLGLPDLTSPDATSLDVIAADQAIKGMLANNNLQIDPQILNNIKQTTNLSDADLNNLVLSNQGDLTKVANLPTLTTGQPGEVDPFVFDGEILGGEPSTETVTPTKDRDFVDADFEDIKTEVGPVKTTTTTTDASPAQVTTDASPAQITEDKTPTPATESKKKPPVITQAEKDEQEEDTDKDKDKDKGTPGQTDQVTTIPVKNNANDKDESPFICPEGYEAVKQNGVWICQPVEKAAKVQRGRPTVGTRPYVTRPGFARRIRS